MGITYKEYNEKYRLPEQAKDEELIMKHKHHCLCYEPGKGKSYPAIHCMLEINKLKNGNANILIMSDATCIKEMWRSEIMPQGILPRNTYMVTDRTAIGAVKEALVKTKWDLIICDECQSLRSGVTRAKSKYAKLVYALTKRTEYVIGMTGTIAGNNNIEPFCVLHNLNIAGMGDINPRVFKEKFCIKELQYGPFGAFEKPTKLNTLGEELMATAYRDGCSFWEYDDNDEMPLMDVSMKTFKVPVTETYKNALEGILQCGEFESTVMKSIALQKAQQALNGFLYYPDSDMKRTTYQVPQFDNPKLDYVVEECKKCNWIVAYRFQEDGHYIEQRLDEAKIKHCSSIKEFRERSPIEHIILVLQCARGKSANLQQGCQNIMYYTGDFSFINFKQMIHRCWRRGQDKPCKVEFLINDPGDKYKVELKIWESLRNKQSIHDTLMSIKRS